MSELRPIETPARWSGREMAARTDWARELRGAEVDALIGLVERIAPRIGGDARALLRTTRDDFEPGAFAPLVDEVLEELEHGKGFVLLRGLPIGRWSPIETLIAYWGMACHLGTPLPNNADGDMIGHVMDLGADYAMPLVRGYDTSAKLSYHVDQCDVVGLLCRRSAREGGFSKLVSTTALHNELLARRPELLELLRQPLCFSRLGEEGPGENPWYEAPVFDQIGAHLHAALGFGHITKGHKLPGAPPLTDAQLEALAVVERVCEEIEFSMAFEPGDVQLLNNGLVAHTRTAFIDWPEPERRRHLLRLWLRVPHLHRGAAYFENWRNGVTPRGNRRQIRLSPR